MRLDQQRYRMLRLGLSNAVRAISRRCLISSRQSFCSGHDRKHQNDLKLVKILNSKIKSMEKTMPAEAPADFPFAIKNNPCEGNMILNRELNGEKIEVDVWKPREDQNFLTLIIIISKQNGTKMKLKVSVSAENISVLSISVMEHAATSKPDDHPLLHFGPYGLDAADDKWQLPLKEFLESRGIKNTYFGFLWESLITKSKQLPMVELKMLKAFLKD